MEEEEEQGNGIKRNPISIMKGNFQQGTPLISLGVTLNILYSSLIRSITMAQIRRRNDSVSVGFDLKDEASEG